MQTLQWYKSLFISWFLWTTLSHLPALLTRMQFNELLCCFLNLPSPFLPEEMLFPLPGPSAVLNGRILHSTHVSVQIPILTEDFPDRDVGNSDAPLPQHSAPYLASWSSWLSTVRNLYYLCICYLFITSSTNGRSAKPLTLLLSITTWNMGYIKEYLLSEWKVY